MSEATDKLGVLLGEDGKAGAWSLGVTAMVGMLGMLVYMMFKGDKRMDKLKKIRDAMQFAATDAQIPRMQLEATLVLGEIANDVLKELRESRDDAMSLQAEFRRVREQRDAGDAEAYAISIEIRDLLRKIAGIPAEEPAPSEVPEAPEAPEASP